MPVRRDDEGKIIDEPTQRYTAPTEPVAARPGPTANRSGLIRDDEDPYEARTVRIGESPNRPRGGVGNKRASSDDDPKTRVVGGRRKRQDVERMQETAEHTDAMQDPIVGWLVVVEGPGKGNGMKLGYGTNSIGRAETERVKIDFGDDQISRTNHSNVTYDPRGRKFYVQHGGGTNLTYLNDQPVLAPTELPPLSHITIGNTIVRFVPLCGETFDWQDTEEAEE